MSDPMLTATSAGGTVQTNTPAQPAAGESAQTTQAIDLAYKSQLSKQFLDSPESLAKLAKPGTKLDNLADAYLKAQDELERKSGQTAVPGKDAKPEDWEKFYATIRPEKAEAYLEKFKREGDLKDLPKLPGLDEWTAETFHKAGLTDQQAEALFKANASKTLAMLADMKTQNEQKAAAATKELETLWGRDYQAKRMDLESSIKTFFGDDNAKSLLASPLANNAQFLDRLAGLNKYMRDAPFRAGSPSSSSASGRTAASVIFSKP